MRRTVSRLTPPSPGSWRATRSSSTIVQRCRPSGGAEHASAVTRAINVLEEKGWARKDETTGHFHPTPRMGRVFGRVLADLDRAEQALASIRHNFTRTY